MSKSNLELFIRRTAVRTSTNESIVDSIIRFQWREANKAASHCSNVEISGLGVFYKSQAKIKKRYKKLNTILRNINKLLLIEQSKKKIDNYTKKKEGTEEELVQLGNMLHSKLEEV